MGPWVDTNITDTQDPRCCTALSPAVVDFRSQAPLSQGLWPHSPLRRLPHIVPVPRSVKPAGHRGSHAFLEAAFGSGLWHRQPTLGRVVSTAWASMCHQTVPTRLGTSPWEGWHREPSGSFGHDAAMLCCRDRLGLTGCPARVPEALRKSLWLEFCWEAREREGCSMRRLPGSQGATGGLGEGSGCWSCCPWWRAWCRSVGPARLWGCSACPSAAALAWEQWIPALCQGAA